MFYFVRTPWLLKLFYRQCIWNMDRTQRVMYLTFDDGPHAQATPYILDCLDKFNAKGTFFCIGKNVLELPDLYQEILDRGHRTGNHTQNHFNGWKRKDEEYFANIQQASTLIHSNLFRPPYGKITRRKLSVLRSKPFELKTIMWDVLSADFDQGITAERCAQNVIGNATNGSIVIFHDSAKAYDRMSIALPKVLEHFSSLGFRFESLS